MRQDRWLWHQVIEELLWREHYGKIEIGYGEDGFYVCGADGVPSTGETLQSAMQDFVRRHKAEAEDDTGIDLGTEDEVC